MLSKLLNNVILRKLCVKINIYIQRHWQLVNQWALCIETTGYRVKSKATTSKEYSGIPIEIMNIVVKFYF